MSIIKRIKEESARRRPVRRYGVNTSPTGSMRWTLVNSASLLELVDLATAVGGAIRLGLSRDGGALAMGVYGDGPEPYTLYSATTEGMEDHISALGAVFEAMAVEQGSA